MNILVTGTAGFIGMHVAASLIGSEHQLTGIDNINAYYDTGLKYARLGELGIRRDDILYNRELKGKNGFTFLELDLSDAGNLIALFAAKKFDVVIHLAAQAGVRYSSTNPKDYINSNIIGFFNLLEACRTYPVKHLIYASSSSVYGKTDDIPFRVSTHDTDHPVSLYAATKKSNEVMAYTYSHLYRIPCTGLRFFTVYGPWGRPDMAYFSFTKNILEGKPISLYHQGALKRDFTFVHDVVEPIKRLIPLPPEPNNDAPYRLMNIGNSNPVTVLDLVKALENGLGKKAVVEHKPMQPGDVYITYADTRDIEQLTGFTPGTPIETGLKSFTDWYLQYYHSQT